MTSGEGRIRKLLVANRAEIAVRILQSARELGLETFAIYSAEDTAHISAAHHAIQLPSSAAYADTQIIAKICRQHRINHVHPGYGFMSESAEFARSLGNQGVTIIGPGWEALERTGDKVKAKALAEECGVPLLPSMLWKEPSEGEWDAFIKRCGYPVLLKLADGGGGRGIRIVHEPVQLGSSLESAKRDGGHFLVEKAAIEGFHHVEVQIIGDGMGSVRHLWERDCSIQRKFQKIIEMAPSLSQDRTLLAKVIACAIRMARHVKYYSLGTFEFLVNEQTKEFFFLEINPRIQVEHTISEHIAFLDLVRLQLQLAQGNPLKELPDFPLLAESPSQPPARMHSIQLRVCAEDPSNNFSLSVGKITQAEFPSGNGVRVDTHIQPGSQLVVSPDFDNLLAKIILTAPSWESCLEKARRSLEDTSIEGVKTNLTLLRGIVSHPDFAAGRTDTQWLERTLPELLKLGEDVTEKFQQVDIRNINTGSGTTTSSMSSAQSTVMLRPTDAWSLTLKPSGGNMTEKAAALTHHLHIDKILLNQFPDALNGLLTYASGASGGQQQYKFELTSTSLSAGQTVGSNLRKGDPKSPEHIVAPLAGKLIEIRVDEDDLVQIGDVVAYVRQMKMEIEVRADRAGRVTWVLDWDENEHSHGLEVTEGTLIAEIEVEDRQKKFAKL